MKQLLQSLKTGETILEEIPLRDTIAHRMENWIPELNISDDEPLLNEARAIEFCRSFTLFCLHESLLKFGQDLKNEQWVMEPFANMVIALAVMDTGFKRYFNLEAGEHKNNTQEVVSLSVVNRFEKTVQCGTDIIHYLFDGEKLKTKMDEVNKWQTAIGYSPDRIIYQKAIVSTLYTHNKYYLN